MNTKSPNILSVVVCLILCALGASMTVSAHADLALSVHTRTDLARPGEQVPVTITVVNTTSSVRNNVRISAVVPAGVASFQESITEASGTLSCSGGPVSATLCEPGETVVWLIGSLSPGQGVPIVFSPSIAAGDNAPPDGTVVTFDVDVSADNEPTVSSSEGITVRSTAPVWLSLDPRSGTARPGALHEYVLTYSNAADAASRPDTSVTLSLPPGISVVSADNGGTNAGSSVVWSLGELAPGDYGRLRATVSLAGPMVGEFVPTTATLQSGDTTVTRAFDVTRIAPSETLAMSVDLGRNVLEPGETLAGHVTVTNRGLTNRTNVRVTVLVPDNVETFSESITEAGSTTSCSGGPISTTSCEAGERLIFFLGDLSPGDGASIMLPPEVSAAARGVQIPVIAWARDDGNHDARAAAVGLVDPTPALAVDARVLSGVARSGGSLEYVLTFSNPSASTTAENAVLTARLPSGTSLLRIDNGGSVTDNVAFWSLGSLAPGQSGAVTLTVMVDAMVEDAELVQFSSDLADGMGNRAWSHRTTRVETQEPLVLSMVLSRTVAGPDDSVVAVLTVTNASDVERSGVQITAVMPDAMQTFSENKARVSGTSSCSGGPVSSTRCERGERLVWILGTLAPGGSQTVALPPIVGDEENGELLLFDAWASDSAGAFTRAMRTAAVRSERALSVSLASSASPVAPDMPIILNVQYASADVAADAQIVLPVPEGTSVREIHDGGNLVGNDVIWSLGSLTPGQSGAVSLTVDVDAGATTGDTIAGRVFLSDAAGHRAWARSATRVDEVRAMALDLRVVPDAARAGETALTVLTVSNLTDEPLDAVDIVAVVPDPVDDFVESIANLASSSSCSGGPVSTTRCEQGEAMIWRLGTLPAGGGASVVVPPIVSEDVAQGISLNTLAWAMAGNAPSAVAQRSILLDSDGPLELDVAPRANPVAAGASLVYDVVFGQVSIGAGSGTLVFALPPGTQFISASDGAVPVGNTVQWQIAGLDQGEGGRVSVQVAIDATLGDGDQLVASASIVQGALPGAQARARSVVRIASGPGLALDGGFLGEPLRPARNDEAFFTVTNTMAEMATDVRVRVTLADDIDIFPESQTTASGTLSCGGGPVSSTQCEQAESLLFVLGDLPSGDARTVSIPFTTSVQAPAGPNGQVTRYHALAHDADGRFAERRIATVIGDGDAVADPFDNCLFTPNDDQRDTDSDGYGNACDADLNNDCIVNVVDLGIFREVFFTTNGDADFNGDGIVNVIDLGILRELFFSIPGPAVGGLCE